MRNAAFLLVGLQVGLLLLIVVQAATTNSDAAGNAMAMGFAVVISAVGLVFAVPAFVVAFFSKRHGIALGLAACGLAAVLVVVAMLS